MIYILTTIIPVLGYAFLINHYFKASIEKTILPVCSCIILVLYFFSLSDLLNLSAALLLYTGASVFLIFLFLHIKNNSLKKLMTYGNVFFVISILFLVLLTQSHYYSYLTYGDDYNHWGRISKVIFFNQRLANISDPVWWIDYPPGTALFHYFSLQLSDYSENGAFFSQSFLLVSAYTLLFSVLNIKKQFHFIFFLFYFYLLSFSFGHGFHTLTVDLLLGILFSTIIIVYWFERKICASILRVAPIIFLLPLIKSAGMFLAITSVIIILFDSIYLKLNKAIKTNNRFIYLILAFVILLALQSSWKNHTHAAGKAATFSTDVSISKIVDAFDSKVSSTRQQTTINNFFNKLSPIPKQQFSGEWEGFYTWIIIVSVLSAIIMTLYAPNSTDKKPLIIYFTSIYIGLFTYIFSLLILYMFSFSEYEGIRNASLVRYLKIYLISIIIYQSFISINFYLLNKKKINIIIFASIFCLCILPNIGKAVKGIKLPIRNWTEDTKRTPDVEKIVIYTDKLKNTIPADSHIHFIWQNSTGYHSQLFGYEMIPRNTNIGCWSIGEKYNNDDVWTCSNINSDKFLDMLKKYNYLFIGKADSNFWNQFSDIFHHSDMQNGSLFKIEKKDAVSLKMIKTY